MTPEIREAFADLIKAWSNWQPHILAYFDHRVTNDITEGLNSLIRFVNRLGRGYSFEALRAKMLFTEGAFKKKTIRPKFDRQRDRDDVMSEMESPEMFRQRMSSPHFPHQTAAQKINYGVEISTLIRLIKEGEL